MQDEFEMGVSKALMEMSFVVRDFVNISFETTLRRESDLSFTSRSAAVRPGNLNP